MNNSLNKVNNSFKKFNSLKKYFLIFNVFLDNKHIEFLLRKRYIGFNSFKLYKTDIENKFYATVQFNLKHYPQTKIKVFNFLKQEDFNFNFIGVCVNNNFMTQDFFEENFLIDIDKYEQVEDIIYCLFISMLNNIILNEKLFFIFYYYILVIQNFIKYGVYNTSSGV